MDFLNKKLRNNTLGEYTIVRLFFMVSWLAFAISPAFIGALLLANGASAHWGYFAPAAIFAIALFAGNRSANDAAGLFLNGIRLILWLVPRFITRAIERFLIRNHRTRSIENIVLAYVDSRRPKNAGSAFARAAASGNRRAAAEIFWPTNLYPHFYAPVPADLARPPFEDGRLHGDVPLEFMADSSLSELQIRRAVRAAAATFLTVVPILLALALVGTIMSAIAQFGNVSFARETLESWGGDHEIKASIVGTLLEAGLSIGGTVFSTLAEIAVALALMPIVALAFAGIAFLSYVGGVFHHAQLKYKFPTKDLVSRANSRVETRREALLSYVSTVALAQTRLIDKKTIELGQATGTARLRGRLFAPAGHTSVAIDEDSLSEGMIVIGSTGSGKTSGPIKRTLYTVLSWADPTWSAYLQDGKGVLHNDVRAKIESLGRRVVTIGTEAGERGVNLLAFLSPLEAAEAMRALSRQMSDEKNIWGEQAAALFRHSLVIAKVWRETEDGRNYANEVADPYSIAGAFNLSASDELQIRALRACNSAIKESREFAEQFEDVDFSASRIYIDSIWPKYAVETRTSVQFSLDALLGEITAQPELYKRFYCGLAHDTVDFSDLLDGSGTVYLSAIGGARHGKNGRIVNMLMNTILVKVASRRQAEIGEAAAKSMPVLAVVDECHLTLSYDKEAAGTDVPSFLSVTRSSGVAWLLATQSVDQLYSAFGEEAAKTLLANLRTKIFLSSENLETIRLATDLGGSVERNVATEVGARESIDHRVVLDGFDLFAPAQWIPRMDARETNTKFGAGLTLALNGLPTMGPMSIEVGGSQSRIEALMKPENSGGAVPGKEIERDRDRDENVARHGSNREALYRAEDIVALGDFHAIVFVRRGRNLFTDKIRVSHIFD